MIALSVRPFSVKYCEFILFQLSHFIRKLMNKVALFHSFHQIAIVLWHMQFLIVF